MDTYLAHSPTEKSPEGQLLLTHLQNVADLSAAFSSIFAEESDGELCGLYHDIGKYSKAFQKRLLGDRKRVDHSTAGAYELFQQKNIPVAMCIAGHHGGLLNIGSRNDLSAGTFMSRINGAKEGNLEDYSAYKLELQREIPIGYSKKQGFDRYAYIKMLFSALTDADWLDTEAYYDQKPYVRKQTDLVGLQIKLNRYIEPWRAPGNSINAKRNLILENAINHGQDVPGVFSMTVPTGGGKTISSLAFALEHAIKNNKERIIYVIPYCSIIEQTQSIFESIFGPEYILAHYSGAETEYSEEDTEKKAVSSENWEEPIILTTAVQFFESFFASKPEKSRKLHNIANSVIVFDEAQMLPVPFLKPCLACISQLVQNYQCSAVLCTATQPAFEDLLRNMGYNNPIKELCPRPEEMYIEFQRVRYVDDGKLTDDELADKLIERDQVLCIVNSRRQAQRLYDLVSEKENVFHLSTMMIPKDRKRTLKAIRKLLDDGKPCKVISTSLIEAGVDIDFPEVFRAMTGLDSVIQSGGRCNREGKRDKEESIVHIFQTDEKAPKMLEQNMSAMRTILQKHEQIDSLQAVHEYFQFLYYIKGEDSLDEKDILEKCNRLFFEQVAKDFRLIDGNDYSIMIPIDEGKALTDQLTQVGPDRQLMRQLRQYSVNVYPQYFSSLYAAGKIERISEYTGILRDPDLYSKEVGLPFDVSEQDSAIFI